MAKVEAKKTEEKEVSKVFFNLKPHPHDCTRDTCCLCHPELLSKDHHPKCDCGDCKD